MGVLEQISYAEVSEEVRWWCTNGGYDLSLTLGVFLDQQRMVMLFVFRHHSECSGIKLLTMVALKAQLQIDKTQASEKNTYLTTHVAFRKDYSGKRRRPAFSVFGCEGLPWFEKVLGPLQQPVVKH